MTYEHLFKILESCQTPSVHAIPFPASCFPNRIPDKFGLLLPEIIIALNSKINLLCTNKELVALFGMQPVSFNIMSSAPTKLKRVCNKERPESHFCCTLDYLVLPKNKTKQASDWSNAKTIVIDFTTGTLMDSDQYLYALYGHGARGMVYDILNQDTLKKIWVTIRKSWLPVNTPTYNFCGKQKSLAA